MVFREKQKNIIDYYSSFNISYRYFILRPVFSNNNMEIIDNSVDEIDISLGVNPTASDSSVKINNNNIYINKGGIYNISGIHINEQFILILLMKLL